MLILLCLNCGHQYEDNYPEGKAKCPKCNSSEYEVAFGEHDPEDGWALANACHKEENDECSCIVPDGRIVCDNCGKRVPVRCNNCGEKMGDAWECPSCGTV